MTARGAKTRGITDCCPRRERERLDTVALKEAKKVSQRSGCISLRKHGRDRCADADHRQRMEGIRSPDFDDEQRLKAPTFSTGAIGRQE